jgi:hypothetical protein
MVFRLTSVTLAAGLLRSLAGCMESTADDAETASQILPIPDLNFHCLFAIDFRTCSGFIKVPLLIRIFPPIPPPDPEDGRLAIIEQQLDSVASQLGSSPTGDILPILRATKSVVMGDVRGLFNVNLTDTDISACGSTVFGQVCQ